MADGSSLGRHPRSYAEAGLMEVMERGYPRQSAFTEGFLAGSLAARQPMENESSWLNALGYHEEDGERG